MTMLQAIRQKIEDGERITPDEGLHLLRDADLLDLAPLAQTWRFRHNPEPIVTYVVDTNLNYTNVCDAYCGFCAFYRPDSSDPSAYTYSVDQIMDVFCWRGVTGMIRISSFGWLAGVSVMFAT